jgi:hypothetical protein
MIIALFAATVLMADSTTALQAASTTTTNAAQTQAVAATAEANAKPKKQANNALVCRNEPVLGSRLPTKRCRTPEQMAAQQQQDQADLDKMQRTGDPGH